MGWYFLYCVRVQLVYEYGMSGRLLGIMLWISVLGPTSSHRLCGNTVLYHNYGTNSKKAREDSHRARGPRRLPRLSSCVRSWIDRVRSKYDTVYLQYPYPR